MEIAAGRSRWCPSCQTEPVGVRRTPPPHGEPRAGDPPGALPGRSVDLVIRGRIAEIAPPGRPRRQRVSAGRRDPRAVGRTCTSRSGRSPGAASTSRVSSARGPRADAGGGRRAGRPALTGQGFRDALGRAADRRCWTQPSATGPPSGDLRLLAQHPSSGSASQPPDGAAARGRVLRRRAAARRGRPGPWTAGRPGRGPRRRAGSSGSSTWNALVAAHWRRRGGGLRRSGSGRALPGAPGAARREDGRRFTPH